MEKEVRTYLKLLEDSLQKKEQQLEVLLYLSNEQKRVLSEEPFSMEKFSELMDQKEPCIEQIATFDYGFEGIYNRLKPVFEKDKAPYQQEIERLQQLIKRITEASVQLKALEEQNKSRLEMRLHEHKKEIKTFKQSSKTVSSYYKNMVGTQTNQSYFMDKKQ